MILQNYFQASLSLNNLLKKGNHYQFLEIFPELFMYVFICLCIYVVVYVYTNL